MLDQVEIYLNTDIGEVPPHLKIYIGDDVIFDRLLEKDTNLKHETKLSDHLIIKIEKSGKTKSVADSRQPQYVSVEKVLLNGLDQHANFFGRFNQSDNSYIEDQSIEGNSMALNGSWVLDVPVFRQPFLPDLKYKFRHSFADARIACFGCSFTFGSCLELEETWPSLLSKDAKNYGVGGSSISSIIGTAVAYLEKHTCEKMAILLPHPCRLQLKDTDGSILTLLPGRTPEVEKKFKQISRDIVMFGEGSLLMSGYALKLVENLKQISKKTELYLSSYSQETYDCLPFLNDDLFKILPFYEMSSECEMASDGEHPGPDHNRIFADQIRPIIGG